MATQKETMAVAEPRTSRKPFLFSCFEVSTAHITENDDNIMNRDDCPVSAYKYEYGYFVYTGAGSYTEEDFRAFAKAGLSEAFIALVRLALKNGCKFLCLDCDGFVYDDLPKFDW